jgi:hypothetical protein
MTSERELVSPRCAVSGSKSRFVRSLTSSKLSATGAVLHRSRPRRVRFATCNRTCMNTSAVKQGPSSSNDPTWIATTSRSIRRTMPAA